jgi:hypothetical protein
VVDAGELEFDDVRENGLPDVVPDNRWMYNADIVQQPMPPQHRVVPRAPPVQQQPANVLAAVAPAPNAPPPPGPRVLGDAEPPARIDGVRQPPVYSVHRLDEIPNDGWNIDNADNRDIEVSLAPFNVVHNRKETCRSFFTCETPDFIEDIANHTVMQHRYLMETERQVMLPESLPEEIARKWVSTRDEENVELAMVVAALTENYGRRVNTPARTLLDCKMYIPNIAALMTRDEDYVTSANTSYTTDRRFWNAVSARIKVLYYLLLPLIAILVIMFQKQITDEAAEFILDVVGITGLKGPVVKIMLLCVLQPVVSEFVKRATLNYDGTHVRVVMGTNYWVVFWYSLMMAMALRVSAGMRVVIIITELAMGYMRYVPAVVMHVIINILLFTPLLQLVRAIL